MNEVNKTLWIKLRAEVIKHFNEKENGFNLKNGVYDYNLALKVAEFEFNASMRQKEFFLNLDEMILLSLDECVDLARDRAIEYLKSIV